MKNLLHSSLVIASILASQSASAGPRPPQRDFDKELTEASSVSKSEHQLDELLYGEARGDSRKAYRDPDARHRKGHSKPVRVSKRDLGE